MFTQNTAVTDRLFDALKNNPQTKDVVVDIAFNQGIFTITGRVKSEKIRKAVEEVAKSQPDVVTVINEMKVQT